jgi:hypothetical protein
MKVFSYFFALAFLVFFGVGYWQGTRQQHPSLEEHVMSRLHPATAGGQPILIYKSEKSRFAAYDPKTEKLTTNIPSKGSGAATLANIDAKLLTLIGGATLGLNVDSVAGSHTIVRFLNRATGSSRKNRILGTIFGSISGYSVGEYFGARSTVSPDSDEIAAAITDEKVWKSIRTKYSAYRLAKLRVAVDDLPAHIADPFLKRIEDAEQKLVLLRSSSKEESLYNELVLVEGLERDVQPHFRLFRGWWDSVWGDFLTQMHIFMYAFLAMLAIFVLLASYSILGEKIPKRIKKRKR